MSQKRQGKKINLILTIIALGLLALLLFLNRTALKTTWEILQDIDWWWLATLPLLQLASHLFIALTYKSFFKIYGYQVPLSRTLPMVWALNFVNQILPSGGLSGLTYLIYGMRGYVPPGKATLAQLARYVLSYISYALVLAAAFSLLLVGHDADKSAVLLIVWLVSVSLAITAVLVLLTTKPKLMARFIKLLGGKIDQVLRLLRRKKTRGETTGQKVSRVLSDFYGDYRKIAKQWHSLLQPLFFMTASTFFETMIVYVSFLIVGADVNPGFVLISFAIANGVGVLSVVPGDVGVHEATMVAAMSAAGVPVGVALSGTLLYRVFNKMIFLPIGFISYSRLLKPAVSRE